MLSQNVRHTELETAFISVLPLNISVLQFNVLQLGKDKAKKGKITEGAKQRGERLDSASHKHNEDISRYYQATAPKQQHFFPNSTCLCYGEKHSKVLQELHQNVCVLQAPSDC